MGNTAAPRHQVWGLGAIELCMVVAISALLLSLAIPSLRTTVEKHRADLVSQDLLSAIRLARSEAMRSQTNVKLNVQILRLGMCYLVYAELYPLNQARQPCTCNDEGTARCTGEVALIRQHWLPANAAVQLRSNVSTMNFEATRGIATPTGYFEVVTPSAPTLRYVVSMAGRVRICSPDGMAKQVPRC